VFENRVLRRIFGPKRDEMAGGWRRQHNEELHNLYASPNIQVIKVRMMMWEEHVARMEEVRNAYKIWLGNLKGKNYSEDRGIVWKINVRIDLREIGWEDVDWMHLNQDSDLWRVLVNTVMNHRVL
jgi:hypothetical protein